MPRRQRPAGGAQEGYIMRVEQIVERKKYPLASLITYFILILAVMILVFYFLAPLDYYKVLRIK